MAFIVNPQSDEKVYLQKEFRGSHEHIFAMAVSNQAVYLSAQRFALKDTWYFKRVPLEDVKQVQLVKQKPIVILIFSALMIIFGGLISSIMLWNTYHPTPGVVTRGSGWPIAIFVGGLVLPFVARGRRILVVKMKKGKFKWKPQLAMDKKTRDLCLSIEEDLLEACKRAGIQVAESQ